ncbi:MAG: hypothetical protein ACOH5I_04845 [Oligoflexus sp.]
MQRTVIFPAILILCLLGCNDGSTSDRVKSQALGGQAGFELSLSDFSPSQSADGSRIIFVSRRDDSIAKIVTYAEDRPSSASLETLQVQGEDSEHNVGMASLSPNGQRIVATIQEDADILVLIGFDGSKQLRVAAEQLEGVRINELSWAPDSEVFVVGAQSLTGDGTLQARIWLGLVIEQAGAFSVQLSEAIDGVEPVVADNGKLVYRSHSRDQVNVISYTHDGQQISLTENSTESAALELSPAANEVFFADASRIYLSETQRTPRVRARWGDRQLAEEDVDNIGQLSITQLLQGFDLAQLNPAEDLRFAAYEVYEPANLRSIDTTRGGEILLLVGQQYVACDKLNLYGNQILLVHTGLQTVFPLVPVINAEKQLTGIVSDPCAHVDEEQAAFNQPFDFRIQTAKIEELAPGEFSLVYQSRLWTQPEIYQAKINLPNLETADLTKEELEITVEVRNISNNFQ